ncbi:MAG: guanylate kinase [Synergistes sp.]|nr:guanylate kinase [Synergistes sp.]
MRGNLFIVSGPAGVGKGTIVSCAMKRLGNMQFSVSCTTRKPRAGIDCEGKTYHFITEEEFLRDIETGNFLEYANVHGHLYGTRRDIVEKALKSGTDVILEIDVQGAGNVKSKMPDAVSVFIKPPSADVLRERLLKRGSENAEEQALRLKNAEEEIKHAAEYDYIVVNDDLEKAICEFINIVNKIKEEAK